MGLWMALGAEAGSLLRALSGGGSAQAAAAATPKTPAIPQAAQQGKQTAQAAGQQQNQPQSTGSAANVFREFPPQPQQQQQIPYNPRGFGAGAQPAPIPGVTPGQAQQQLAQNVQQAGNTLQSLAGKLPVIGKVIDTTVEYGKAVLHVTKAMFAFGEAVVESRENLKYFSGTIANSYAQLERQRFRQQFEMAKATSGTTQTLVQSQMELEKSLMPIKEAIVNLTNVLATGVNVGLKYGLIAAEFLPVVGDLLRIAKLLARDANAQQLTDYGKFLDDIQHGRWHEPKNKRPGRGGLAS